MIELLIVITIIVILAAAVFVALNPAKRFADARNARRQEILDAEEAEAERQKEIQEQQAILLEEKKLAKPALEIR